MFAWIWNWIKVLLACRLKWFGGSNVDMQLANAFEHFNSWKKQWQSCKHDHVWSWTFNMSCISLWLSGKNKHAVWQNLTWRRRSKCNRYLSWLDVVPVAFNMQCLWMQGCKAIRFLEAGEPFSLCSWCSCVFGFQTVFLKAKPLTQLLLLDGSDLWWIVGRLMAIAYLAGFLRLIFILSCHFLACFDSLRYQTMKWLNCCSGSLRMFTRTSMAFLAEGGFQGLRLLNWHNAAITWQILVGIPWVQLQIRPSDVVCMVYWFYWN